ncbi:MAG: NAD(P)H-hydrate dehydratase [Clostridia bacterium]|nr:NAD(P)H-hydrate dehydratase [Clostridia bacterium]
MYVVDKATMCNAERLAQKGGTNLYTLMLNAGNAAADYIAEHTDIKAKRVLILCGKGNNGGDGFVVARRLALYCYVTVALVCGEASTDIAKKAFDSMGDRERIAVVDIDSCIQLITNDGFDIVIDAVFGTGYNGEAPTGKLKELLSVVGKSDFALDIPSGLCCDTGRGSDTALKTKVTLTFGAKKLCQVLPFSADICSEVVVLPIGINQGDFKNAGAYIQENEKPVLKCRPKTCHKNSFGTALSVCGSYGMSGAAVISGMAALRSGVGILKAATIKENYSVMATSLPEAVLIPLKSRGKTYSGKEIKVLKEHLKTASALLVGCGLSQSSDITKIVSALLLASTVPTVLDADGINAVSNDIELLRKVKAPIILTPHPKEMARLIKTDTKTVEENRFKTATEFSAKYGVYTILKGANTIIASPNGEVAVNTNGNAGMATAGSGDMLSGILLALLANGLEPFSAAKAAVWLHAAAGDAAKETYGESAMLPSDMINLLHKFL